MGSSFMLIHVVPVAANLSADGTRVPGGYAVQVGGNITFTCTHNGSSERSLFWEYDITNRTATANANTAANLRDKPGIGTSATENTDNPVSITIYNLQLANNGSTVKCQLEKEGSPAVILVEGMILHCICAPSSLCVPNIVYSCNYVIDLHGLHDCALPPIICAVCIPCRCAIMCSGRCRSTYGLISKRYVECFRAPLVSPSLVPCHGNFW